MRRAEGGVVDRERNTCGVKNTCRYGTSRCSASERPAIEQADPDEHRGAPVRVEVVDELATDLLAVERQAARRDDLGERRAERTELDADRPSRRRVFGRRDQHDLATAPTALRRDRQSPREEQRRADVAPGADRGDHDAAHDGFTPSSRPASYIATTFSTGLTAWMLWQGARM